MSEFVQILIIETVFLGFLIALITLVVLNPDKVKIKSRKKEDNTIQEVSVALDSDTIKKD